MKRNQQTKQVKGWIEVPFDVGDDDDNDSSDEDEEEAWLDYRDFMSGAEMVKSKNIKTRKVTIIDSSKARHICNGKFPLQHKFWTVTAKINNYWLKCPPAYSIQHCLDQTKEQSSWHAMQLLEDCLKAQKSDVCNATKACFEIFCRQANHDLSLFNLETLIEEYKKTEADQCQFIKQPDIKVGNWLPQDHGVFMIKCVLKSELGATALRAVSHPDLVETVSKLLPTSFQGFFSALPKESADKAADMARNTVWEFGFRQIVFQKLKVQGVEGHLSAYEKGDFLPSMPQLYKDALYIYEGLKLDARNDGHMYMPYRNLTGFYFFRKKHYLIHQEQRWRDALTYLKENEVIVMELFDQDNNIFLRHNWQAEVDIANGMKKILTSYTSCLDDFDVDFTCPEFDKIRKDADQVRALNSASSLPITVLSGSGGCGKTTVVTTLLKHLYDREEERLRQEESCQENSLSLDDSTNIILNEESGEIEHLHDGSSTLGEIHTHSSSVNTASDVCNKNDALGIADVLGRVEINVVTKRDDEQKHSQNAKEMHDDDIRATDKTTETDDSEKALNSISRNTQKETESEAMTESKKEIDDLPEVFHSEEEKPERSNDVEEYIGKDLRKALVSDLIKILKEKRQTDSSEMEKFKQQILLTAPTGKAARLLGHKASLPSATIHSAIMSWRRYQNNPELKANENEWKYANVKILVVDECSLVSVRLFSTILNILLKHAELRKVILLGDIKQLPSIEPGQFLRDIFKALSYPGLSIELTHNHRSESSLIVDNAKKISHQHMPTIDPRRRFYWLEIQENGVDYDRDEVVRQLLQTNDDMQCHIQSQFVAFRNSHCKAINELCCKHYNGHSIMRRKGQGTKEVQDFRPGDKICLGKNNLVSSNKEILLEYVVDNEYFKSRFLPNEPKGSGKRNQDNVKLDSQARRNVLTVDETTSLFTGDEDVLDKTVAEMRERNDVLQRERNERIAKAAEKSKAWKSQKMNDSQNSTVKKVSQEKNENVPLKTEDKLCNGEVFFIMDEKTVTDNDGHAVNYFVLSDRDPQLPNVVCVAERVLRRECKMKHSWARTIHTYQGSESQTVIYVLGNAIPQNWQHVYTAVTRGKKSVYIVSKSTQLQIAVSRRDKPRKSRLCSRMKDMLLDNSDTLEETKQHFLENNTSTQSQSVASTHDGQATESVDVDIHLPDSDDSWLCSLQDPSMNNDIDVVKDDQKYQILEPEDETVDENLVFSFDDTSQMKDESPKAVIASTSRYIPDSHMTSPPRPTVKNDASHVTPPKICRLETDLSVDTPFRHNFSQSLSIDDSIGIETIEGTPSPPSTSLLRKNVRRKL